MAIELKLPKINAETPDGKIQQMQSFLYQHIEELDWALGTLEKNPYEAIDKVAEENKQTTLGVMTQVNRLGKKTSAIAQDIDSIKMEVAEVSKDLEGTTTKVGTLEVRADSITADVKAIGDDYVKHGELEVTEDRIMAQVTEEIDGETVVYDVGTVMDDYNSTQEGFYLKYPTRNFTDNIVCGVSAISDTLTFEYSEDALKKHKRDIAFYANEGFTYRFTKDSESGIYYWKQVADSDFGIAMNKIAQLEVTADGISADVKRQEVMLTQQGIQIKEQSTSIKQTADAITAEAKRAGDAEGALSSRITQNATSISSEVTRASEAEGALGSRITQTAEAITSEVARAGNAEEALSTRITQTAEAITSKVSKTDYNGETVASMINQSAEGVKILAKHLDIAGAVTFSTFDSSTQAYINGIGNTASNASSAASTAQGTADGIANNIYLPGTTTINGGVIDTDTLLTKRISVSENGKLLFRADNNHSGLDKVQIGPFKVDYNSLYIGYYQGTKAPDVFISDGLDGNYTLAGHTDTNWVFGAGTKFGVLANGDIYAQGLHIMDSVGRQQYPVVSVKVKASGTGSNIEPSRDGELDLSSYLIDTTWNHNSLTLSSGQTKTFSVYGYKTLVLTGQLSGGGARQAVTIPIANLTSSNTTYQIVSANGSSLAQLNARLSLSGNTLTIYASGSNLGTGAMWLFADLQK